jgi:hypothetical protein
MSKKIVIYLLAFIAVSLHAFTLEYFPKKPAIDVVGGFSVISNLQAYEDKPGAPMLPLETIFIKLPNGEKIGDIEIVYENEENIRLKKALKPIQRQQPLLSSKNLGIIPPQQPYYSQERFPAEKLISSGHGYSGNSKIGRISFYSAQYLPLQKTLVFPQKIIINYELIPDPAQRKNKLPDSFASWQIQQNMGIKVNRDAPEPVYLLVLPEQFLAAYQPLIEWRQKQGINVLVGIYEEIVANRSGVDEQQMLRDYVRDKYQEYGVSHLTIGADDSIIPSRITFAFDCNYGSQIDENELLCDMYFGCLDGSWDANGNQIYGEDDDNPDYLAEVFVSRIPAENSFQVSSYVEKLIGYEQGNIEEYQKAGGFSMELWSGSNSQVCQQFIYDKYFPDDYEIDFLYGQNNNDENAYDLINSNLNCAQHTGHGWFTVLSLEDGNINQNNLYNMQNDWGGIFYSIGCWTAALDYDAIGEDIVRKLDSGFLGYIGNSRYGWGAPAAPGFGFSEFYQKEMFRLFFQEEIYDLAALNYSQKIPYFPYFSGKSIYKWVGYELNALGDSFCRFYNQNPAEMQLTAINLIDSVKVKVYSEESPVANAVVTIGNHQGKTDRNGEICLPYTEQVVSAYKYGYKFLQTELADIFSNYELTIDTELELAYEQGEQFQVESVFYNNTNENVDFEINYCYNEADIQLEQIGQQPESVEANSNVNLAPVQIYLKSIAESYQMQDGKIIPFILQVTDPDSGEILAQHTFKFKIAAPAFQIRNLQWANYSLEAGGVNDFYFELHNIGSIGAENVQIDFVSDSEWISFAESSIIWPEIIEPGEYAIISNQLQIDADSPEEWWSNLQLEIASQEYLFSQNINLPQDSFGYFNDFETNFDWTSSEYWQLVDTYAFQGENSLSCRPQNIGYYAATSDYFYFLSGMELSFKYRYKMPMYGEDGFYVRLLSETRVDTLIFLGAGGALPPENKDGDYIESDWKGYSLNIEDLTTATWQEGELFQIDFLFSFPVLEEGFNDYGNMPQIGIFLDQLALSRAGNVNNENEEVLLTNKLQLYPNPFNPILNIKIESEKSETLNIFNVKGQKVAVLQKQAEEQNLKWNAAKMSSGIYFIRWQHEGKTITKKSLLLK